MAQLLSYPLRVALLTPKVATIGEMVYREEIDSSVKGIGKRMKVRASTTTNHRSRAIKDLEVKDITTAGLLYMKAVRDGIIPPPVLK